MEKAMLKHQILQKIIMKLFRFMEMFIFLFMISKSSSQLPNVSVDYFKRITFTIFGYFSPKFMFVIINLIILILFFKSESGDRKGNDDLCYEYIERYNMSVISYASVISTTTSSANVIVDDSDKRPICRSKSENKMKRNCRGEQTHRELRRSVTELSRSKNFGDGGDGGDSGATAVVVGDKLSCEEFRQTVEDFIARRQKLLRDEEFSPMVYIGS